MTSYGGPSLGPKSPAHGSQRVYLGHMVKGLMVQPWSLGQPENIWHGMLLWSTHAGDYIGFFCACHPPLWSRNRQLYRFSGYFRLHAGIYTVATTKLESSRIRLACRTFSPN